MFTPKACLVKDNTMTILMKEVVIIKILGANVKIVNQITIWIPFVKSCGVLAGCIPIFIFGNETGAAQAGCDLRNGAAGQLEYAGRGCSAGVRCGAKRSCIISRWR